MPRNVLLLTHLQPVIHGQALMANLLLQESAAWDECTIHAVNTVYDEDRAKLRGFTWGKIRRLGRYLWQARTLAKEHQADLVITTMAFFPGPFLKDCLLVFFCRWFLSCRVLIWVHMDPSRLEYERRPAWFRWIADLMLRSIDGWVACAPTISQTWPAWMKGKAIVEIANGIADHPCRAHPGQNRRLTVLFLSVIDREKGWRELFAAATNLCSERNDVDFVFRGSIGINENATEVNDLFAHSAYPNRIRYEGPAWGEEKKAVMQGADVFCLPSHTEAFPLAILEAMSYGLPCVVTNVGAVKEAVREGEEGWFCLVDNTASLTLALRTALHDHLRLGALGAAARIRFENHFTSEIFGQRWQQLIAE